MKIFKFLLCSLLLMTCITVPVFANDDTETFSIAIDYTNPNGYSQTFVDEDGYLIEMQISPVEEIPITRGTSTEELGYGTYTRTASITFTHQTSTDPNDKIVLSFKFKATISATENPRLHSISNIVRKQIYTESGPTIYTQYATPSQNAYISASGTGSLLANEITKYLSIKVYLSYSEILTIQTSTSTV